MRKRKSILKLTQEELCQYLIVWKVILVDANYFNMCNSIIFFWFGWEIYRGNKKFYRLIAGNIFGDNNDSVEKHHKGLGIFYLCFGVLVLTMIFWK